MLLALRLQCNDLTVYGIDPRILEAIYSDDVHFFSVNMSYTLSESEYPRK